LKRTSRKRYLKATKNIFLLLLNITKEFPIILLLVKINNKTLAFSRLKVENIVAKELTSIKPTTAARI
jgi:hypothetical protein